MFALINSRGSQIGLYDTKAEAEKEADAFNALGLDVFAWVVDAPADAEVEYMPGRGLIYGCRYSVGLSGCGNGSTRRKPLTASIT